MRGKFWFFLWLAIGALASYGAGAFDQQPGTGAETNPSVFVLRPIPPGAVGSSDKLCGQFLLLGESAGEKRVTIFLFFPDQLGRLRAGLKRVTHFESQLTASGGISIPLKALSLRAGPQLIATLQIVNGPSGLNGVAIRTNRLPELTRCLQSG